MSNVIIGIIGVVLFIMLAIAGSLYLGSGLLDAQSSRKATIVLTSGRQMATAVQLYQTRRREIVPNSLDVGNGLITARMLKSIPTNPVVPANAPFTSDINGSLTSARPGWILMYMGQSKEARNVCLEIERAAGNRDRLDEATMETTIIFLSRARPGRIGCHRNQGFFGGNGGASAGEYLAYIPV